MGHNEFNDKKQVIIVFFYRENKIYSFYHTFIENYIGQKINDFEHPVTSYIIHDENTLGYTGWTPFVINDTNPNNFFREIIHASGPFFTVLTPNL